MAISGALFHVMTALVATFKKQASRATRKMRKAGKPRLGRRVTVAPFLDAKKKVADDEGEVWRREILMGEKCQPIAFSGAIYYDTRGRRLDEIPTPRSPCRSPLPAFAFHPAIKQ